MRARTSGFTLVELSIVLVVIGLIVAGILLGGDMIEGARRRKTIQQMDEYRAAVNAFKNKYAFYPGDLPYPERYFDLTNLNASYKGLPSFGGHAGYGNGLVDNWGDSVMTWIELSKSGILPLAVLDGTAAYPTFSYTLCGVNQPVSPYADACFQIINTVNSFTGTSGQNWLTLGGQGLRVDPAWYYSDYPAVPPTAASWIDAKMDDGKPGTGRFIARNGAGNNAYLVQLGVQYGTGNYCSSGGNYPNPAAVYQEKINEATCITALKLD